MIYFDNAATSFPRPEQVYIEMDRVNRNFSVNAGRGSYKAAKEAAELIQYTKSNIVKLFQCDGLADVVFSPSVTLAMNQIIKGLNIDSNTVIYISPYEHNAVARTIEAVRAKTECEICFLPLDDLTLEIDLKKMEYLFHEKKPDIVISTVISNVTGYRIPVEKIFEVAQSYSSITIADAAQAAGLIDIDYKTFHADIIAFAGHKTLCGPFGIGGFVIRKDLTLDQVLTGGTGSDSLNLKMPEESPNRYEAGSKNIVAIAGLKAALNWLEKNPHRVKIQELTEYLINKMLVNDKITVLSPRTVNKCYGIVSFVVEGYESNEVGSILDDEFDIAVRTGYHCAPYIHDYLESKKYGGTVRIGIGPFNTKEEIDILLEAIDSL
ncbi:MAG: aminotransferase class V-fold PLP-dependent enzyme [Blautia wexlerae]